MNLSDFGVCGTSREPVEPGNMAHRLEGDGIVQKDARIAELIGERDSLMDQCHGLQRLADERDGLRMRAATLEKALIEEMAARMWADEIFRYEGHLTWAEVHESEKEAGRQKARAVLEKKEVAP